MFETLATILLWILITIGVIFMLAAVLGLVAVLYFLWVNRDGWMDEGRPIVPSRRGSMYDTPQRGSDS